MTDTRTWLRWLSPALMLAVAPHAGAQAAATVVDRDSDGLIEIVHLDDLDDIRRDLRGRSLRGSSTGCPEEGCRGYELTRDLDFDTNGNGRLDAEDWNQGRPWTPIYGTDPALPAEERQFSGTFHGNGHRIRSLQLRSLENVADYGLFASVRGASLMSVRLEKVDADVRGAIHHSVAGLVGRAVSGSWLQEISVEGTLVSDARFLLAGVAGELHASRASDLHFSGQVQHLGSADAGASTGGLIGRVAGSLLSASSARGSVRGPHAAGLVESVSLSGIMASFANVLVHGSLQAGGLANRVDDVDAGLPQAILADPNYRRFESVYALGSITTRGGGGGLITALRVTGEPGFLLKNSYAKNVIANELADTRWANLVGRSEGDGIVVDSSYWVKDPAGSILPANSGFALPAGQYLVDLQCATPNIDNGCARPLLLQSWTGAEWDFGSASELPAVIQSIAHPWVNGDTPNATGDYETVASLRTKFPDVTCDEPLKLFAKEKNSPYVFVAQRADDVLAKFSASEGLVCQNADQPDGSCADFSVRYLCGPPSEGGPAHWTPRVSRDTPVGGGGDDEATPANPVCEPGRALGIEALADQQEARLGPPRRLQTFNHRKGLRCVNSEGACQDYRVRMQCLVAGDR